MTGILLACVVLAHSWYPPQCCAEQDCKEVPCERIQKRGDVYRYEAMTFPFGSHAYSPDGKCHVCLYARRSPRCIFTPVPAGA